MSNLFHLPFFKNPTPYFFQFLFRLVFAVLVISIKVEGSTESIGQWKSADIISQDPVTACLRERENKDTGRKKGRGQLLGTGRVHCGSTPHTHSDELEPKHTAAASLLCTTGNDQHISLLLFTHKLIDTCGQDRSRSWVAELSSPSSLFPFTHCQSLHLVCFGCMVYCCVRARKSQREACLGRASTDLYPPTSTSSQELRT